MSCEFIKMLILTAVSVEIKTSEVNLEGLLFALKKIEITKLRGDFVRRNVHFASDVSDSSMTETDASKMTYKHIPCLTSLRSRNAY